MRDTLVQLAQRAHVSGSSHTLSVEQELDAESIAVVYPLYQAAFEPLRTRAIARQVLHADEFVAEMTDPRIDKILARDRDGTPIGLTILTNALETVPWISPEYFAARYPQHAERNAIYYLGFTLVSPEHRRSRVFEDMLAIVTARLVADGAVCGYDICAFNNEALRFAANIESVLKRQANVTVARLDSQTYYGADFS